MKIYTKTGDTGKTSLYGGQRVSKGSIRVEAYGQVDELNSALGLSRSFRLNDSVDSLLHRVQNELFVLGADLASLPSKKTKPGPVNEDHIRYLEQQIDIFEEELEPLKFFILPGGTSGAAALHMSRTICRRAERTCIRCAETEEVPAGIIIYLNRLSDLLFVLARVENKKAGITETRWKVR